LTTNYVMQASTLRSTGSSALIAVKPSCGGSLRLWLTGSPALLSFSVRLTRVEATPSGATQETELDEEGDCPGRLSHEEENARQPPPARALHSGPLWRGVGTHQALRRAKCTAYGLEALAHRKWISGAYSPSLSIGPGMGPKATREGAAGEGEPAAFTISTISPEGYQPYYGGDPDFRLAAAIARLGCICEPGAMAHRPERIAAFVIAQFLSQFMVTVRPLSQLTLASSCPS
jgi:hypothetical protein